MEVKKTKKADLERKRVLFLQIGFVVALGCSLVAFEWNTSENKLTELAQNDGPAMMEELPPITLQEEHKVELPKPPPPIAIEELIIVDDKTEIPEELDINSETTEDEGIEIPELADEEYDGNPIPFVMMADKPEFPGGEKALLKYLAKAVDYPVIAQENGIQGTVYLSFVIGKTGKVTDVKLLRGVDTSLDKEAIRVVSGMPDWKPGKQRNRPVSVSYQVPIRFALQ